MTQSVSTRGPTLTLRNVTLPSPPTTATLYRFCSSCTARCGTRSAPALRVEQDPRAAVLAGPQDVVGVREIQLHAERAGGGVDGALDRRRRACVRVTRAVGQRQLDAPRASPSCRPASDRA